MQWRNGFLGLGLVSALVVGGIADQPASVPLAAGDTAATEISASSPGPLGGGVPMPGNQLGTDEIRPQVGSAGELIGFNGFDGSGSQTITLVHAGKMQIAVYHIDRLGQIHLVSSRPIDADFSLSLNVTKPLPAEIRLLGGQTK